MKKETWTKILAITGTVLVGIPILWTVVTASFVSVTQGRLVCDFLMPAELFLFALAGGLLLLWAAFRAQLLRKPIAIGLVAICVFLAASQLIAVLSSIASGVAEAVGAIWILIIVLLALYTAAVIGLMAAGIVLTKRVFRKPGTEVQSR